MIPIIIYSILIIANLVCIYYDRVKLDSKNSSLNIFAVGFISAYLVIEIIKLI